ncbi:MAG: alternate F1F0 ATPase, F1 subunit alpha [Gammaproteobacteria bacterium]|nr:alternate F1F0 ATPase, F1 subunit alpha [Gammaproteobacteria bacterium]
MAERPAPDALLARLTAARAAGAAPLAVREIGIVHTVGAGVAQVSGLPGLGYEELVRFEGGATGIAFNIDEHDNGIVLLSDPARVRTGSEVERAGGVMNVPVGPELLGRVVDPLGQPLDGGAPPATSQRLPIERPAPHILDRAPVTVPLQTGIKVIDAAIPIGRGQRELVLGDRGTGKTAVVLDTIVNQADSGVLCVYCAIGQRASAVARLVAELRERGALDYTVVVVSEGSDAPGLRYVAPYAATSIAEWFMTQGHDVLIAYDDLTHHARAYRELSLLLRRPPGREAYPGDIFYVHARLLERATRLDATLGGGSLTALPVLQTEAESLADYIPTNLISITDGQIYLSPRLFELGQLPAVDVGRSVSRVGGKAQLGALARVAGPLKLAYSQFEEMETFARFGTRLDERTRAILEHGRRTRALLQQPEFAPVPALEQIVVLSALTAGLFDGVPLGEMGQAEGRVRSAAAGLAPALREALLGGAVPTPASAEAVLAAARTALAEWSVDTAAAD